MNQLSKDLVDHLVTQSAGWVAPEWPLINAKGSTQNFLYNFEPDEDDTPDEFTTIFDTGGPEQDPANNVDFSTAQVRVRHREQDLGWAQIQKIKLEIEGIAPITINSTELQGLWSATNIALIGRDSDRRFIWVWNLRAMRKPNPSGNRVPALP